MRAFLLVGLPAVATAARVLRTQSAVDDADRLKKRARVADMRTDDREGEDAAASCVDCPSYVNLSAAEKKKVLWSRITSDEYKVPFETRCAGERGTCVCDGEVRFGAKGKFTPWKPVRDKIRCTKRGFGGQDPIRWRRKECYCRHRFPMDWVGMMKRNMVDQRGRVKNGTMSMFFDRFSDENPPNAAKVIHTFGSTVLVRFVAAGNTSYTGMFKDGAEHAVLRFSIVADWTKPCKGGTDLNFKGCFKPSLALKMLRDGDYSSNTVAQINLGDGVGWNFDFFRFTHGTLLPTPTGMGAKIVTDLFKHAAEEPEINGVGLQELASGGSKARQCKSQIKAPDAIFFAPSCEVRGKFSNDVHDVRHDLDKIKSGTKIYDVFSVDFKDSRCSKDGQPQYWADLADNCPKKLLGHVETTSRVVASAYQDHRLFFQHERLKTKGGKWARKKCVSLKPLKDTSEYRMAGDPTVTCTQACPSGTEALSTAELAVAGACPFAELE